MYEQTAVYTGKQKHSKRTMILAITLDSPAAKIIADAMENGASIRQAHAEVEDWLRRRHESGEEHVQWWGLSVTYSCYFRMNPTITVVQKRAEGSNDQILPGARKSVKRLNIVTRTQKRKSETFRAFATRTRNRSLKQPSNQARGTK